MIAVISVDMRHTETALKAAAEQHQELLLTAIVDPTLIRLNAELAAEKGWLGEGMTRQMQTAFVQNFRNQARAWLAFAQAFCRERDRPCTTLQKEGHFKELVLEIADRHDVSAVLFSRLAGLNPYWNVARPVVDQLCSDLHIHCSVTG